MIDMVYTAFLFGAVAFLIVAAFKNRPKVQDPGYVLLALAVMTKGPVALVLPGLLISENRSGDASSSSDVRQGCPLRLRKR